MRLLTMTFPPNHRAQLATFREQLAKITEEHAEVVDAHVNKTHAELAEEIVDLMVACDGLLDKIDDSIARQAIMRVLHKGHERGDWRE